jgi:cellulose 1,4-beta-cellobiosidase
MDTSRNAVQGLRYSWDDWCNVGGAGIGRRPTGETKDERLDAFVWVKRPGESDGTNNSASEDYNPFCGNQDAFKPSPAKGQWNQKYFEMLVENAKPSL